MSNRNNRRSRGFLTPIPRSKSPVPDDRRGVLLLVILGMLTLFLMIGTAFIVSSNQFRKANKTYGKVGEQKNLEASQKGFLGEVINQIIRDTNNQSSALRFHSLLRDMYGNDGLFFPGDPPPTTANIAGSIMLFNFAGGSTNVTNGQFLEFRLPPNYRDSAGLIYKGGTYRAPSIHQNGFNGRIVTFLDGPAAGYSTRIVGYLPDTANPPTHGGIVRVLNFPAENGLPINSTAFLNNMNNRRILISGRPFNGTGVGYNPSTTLTASSPKLSAEEQVPGLTGVDTPIALLPNAPFFLPQNLELTGVSNYFSPVWQTLLPAQQQALLKGLGYDGLGGSDESYDAPDFQNMFLAWTSPDPRESVAIDANNLGAMVLPSYHRPELINYWAKRSPFWSAGSVTTSTLTDPANTSLLRKILLRPNWLDHPGFTGSNPEFEASANNGEKLARMIYGPWDVDNDMDGIRDSIWVDFGAPVMVGSKGKLVKPLAAIMILDMDSRLNVNAHGTRELAGDNGEPAEVDFAGGVESDDAPRGQAFGVADISLKELLYSGYESDGDPGNSATEPGTTNAELREVRERLFARLLRGAVPGDYFNPEDGLDQDGNNVAGSGRFFSSPIAGRYGLPGTGDDEPGLDDRFDLSAQLKMQGFPTTNPLVRSNFGTMPDLRARYSAGLNDFGQWITDYDTSEIDRLTEDNPYEMSISASGNRGTGTSIDQPFSPAELERLLRAYDLDAGTLPSRLYDIAGGFRMPAEIDSTQRVDTRRLNQWRTLLTTDSYDVPDVGLIVPPVIRGNTYTSIMNRQPLNVTYAELIEHLCRSSQASVWRVTQDNTDATRLPKLRRYVASLVAPEMLAGMRFDLNRPIGNGRDDDDNGVVDEPGEDEGALWRFDRARLSPNEDGNDVTQEFERSDRSRYHDNIDRDGDGDIDAWERGDTDNDGSLSLPERVNLHNYRRQLLARHLYVLAQAMVDPIIGTSADAQEARRERARQLAQWAINAVDFRDPDNIMTPFEYVVDPFTRGWFVDDNNPPTPVDGIPNATYATTDDVQLVWGAEKPELLITETLAWHDRATHDLRTEDPVNDEAGDGKYQNHYAETINPGQEFSDTDFDQRFRPQGAAFIELYNPNAPSAGASADIHGVQGITHNLPGSIPAGSDLGVNIAKTHNNTPTGSPVWRIIAYRSMTTEKTALSKTPFLTGANADSDPDDADTKFRPKPDTPTTAREEELMKRIVRSVYFTGRDPNYTDDGVAFYNDSASVDQNVANIPTIRPGRYMVVGSGEDIGGGRYLAKFGETQATGGPNKRGIVLDTNFNPANSSVMVQNATGPNTPVTDVAGFPVETPSESQAVTANIGLVPNADTRFNSTASVAIINSPRRFTLTEPAKGYPNLVHTSSYSSTSNQYSPVIDIPLDDQRGTFATDPTTSLPITNFAKWSDAELAADQLTDREDRLRLPVHAGNDNVYRVIPGYSWIYLQRLANPLLPYDAVTNPYMTVDSSGANVTVFNGRAGDEKRWVTANNVADAWWKPLPPPFPVTDSAPPFAMKSGAAPMEFDNGNAITSFSSVQRGRENNPDPQDSVNDTDIQLFQSEFSTRPVTSGYAVDPNTFTTKVLHNLWTTEQIGKRNKRPVGVWRNRGGNTGNGMGSGDAHWFQGVPDCTLGFMNEPFRGQSVDPGVDPQKVRDRLKPTDTNGSSAPFSMITWHNRPFANSGELMLVPAYRGLQLNRNASFINQASASATLPRQEVYSGPLYDNGTVSVTNPRRFLTEFPYRNLLNFFRTQVDSGIDATPNTDDDKGIAGLYRVLDLVTTSSLYVGSETWLNPAAFSDLTTTVSSPADPRYDLQPPFNKVSSRREPGRININTIAGEAVWNALFHGDVNPNGNGNSHAGPSDNDLSATRRGYPDFNDKDPTLLNANYPSLFVNPFRASGAGDLVPVETAQTKMIRQGVDVGLTRTRDGSAANANPEVPLTVAQTPEFYRNAARNPNFRHSPISRLSAMTTNRSNVYAIWVTIGFFEVEEAPTKTVFQSRNPGLTEPLLTDLYNRVYPDGYTFTKEAGIDTGEVERVREFAIVDRTIPVGFEPGANHNIQEIVRLRRRIQE